MQGKKLIGMLDQYWQKIVDDLVQSLYDVGRVSSGATAQSIGSLNTNPVTVVGGGFKIQISMPPYYQFLDEGVSGAKYNQGVSRFKYTDKMPPIKAIRKFMLNRGITEPRGSNTSSGGKRDAEAIRNGIAFAIARSIYEKGLKPTHFYSNVINDKELLDFESKLMDQYSKYVIDIIAVK